MEVQRDGCGRYQDKFQCKNCQIPWLVHPVSIGGGPRGQERLRTNAVLAAVSNDEVGRGNIYS